MESINKSNLTLQGSVRGDIGTRSNCEWVSKNGLCHKIKGGFAFVCPICFRLMEGLILENYSDLRDFENKTLYSQS
jgi:hypothetical protein